MEVLIKRIFLETEAEGIERLQQNAPEFNKHYPKHSEWLQMAIKDIPFGRRFAFGAYKTVFDDRRNPSVSLIGSIILKKETYSHIIQLKNLYLHPDERRGGVGTKLFEAVEQFCIKRGAVGIDTEVPYEEMGTINFLNTVGFVVQNLFDSPYKKGDKIYRMYKRLPNKYTGDPFDLFQLSCWLFETLYDFRVVDRKEPNLQFVSEPKFDFETAKNSETSRICGRALVLGERAVKAKVIDFHSKNKEHLLAVVAPDFARDARKYCEKQRILTLDKMTVEKEFKSALAVDIPPFNREEISGMIVRLNSKYLDSVINGQESRTYFKGGPIGRYLKKNDLILFFVEQGANFTDGGIWAFSELDTCEVGSPAYIWEKYQNRTIFPKKDFLAWCVDKTEIVALCFSKVVEIELIPYGGIKEAITETTFEEEQLGHFYLSNNEVAKFLRNVKTTNKHTSQATENEIKEALNNIMDPITVISAISAGLNLIDKFRDVTLKFLKRENKPVSIEAKQEGNKLQIKQDGLLTEEVTANNLRLDEWNQVRYVTLKRKTETNWIKYNKLESELPILATDEKVRIEIQMEKIREELCHDFREMIQIYERTLGISLNDHYSLYNICNPQS